MNHYKRIYIPVFLSLLFHGLFIYFFTLNLSRSVQIDRDSTLFVELVKPEAEKAEIVQRKMIESPPGLATKGTARPLKPIGGLKMAGIYNKINNIQRKPLISKREVAIQASSPMGVQAAKIPMVLAGRTITARLKPNAFSPDGKTFLVWKKETFIKRAGYSGPSQKSAKTKNAYFPQYNIDTEGRLDMELFKYSTPFVQGAEDATTTSLGIPHQEFTGYTQSAQWPQKNTASFRYASTSNPANESSWADQRFRTMVMGKIENAKIYPEIARRTGIEGDVFVRLSISSDGRVGNVELIPPTTHHKILKKSAVNTVRNAAPYLPIPIEMKNKKDLVIKVKISYRLR